MTAQTFLRLIKHAELARQKNSDRLISFAEMKMRLEFDSKAEDLIKCASLITVHKIQLQESLN